ncbi:MAG: hypothetical protein JSV86_16190 [Gemmatimonadota bacterium]|nr:MAG: hypothetical protein JSV86_16190 [Gemmatimonadota bacterium]
MLDSATFTAWCSGWPRGDSPKAISEETGYHIEHVYRLLGSDVGRETLSRYRGHIEATIVSAVRELVPEVLGGRVDCGN